MATSVRMQVVLSPPLAHQSVLDCCSSACACARINSCGRPRCSFFFPGLLASKRANLLFATSSTLALHRIDGLVPAAGATAHLLPSASMLRR